ncbi:maltose excess protein 1-like, chloroplastic isoform X2 [Salvia splendens]|uniref:maltose excess protein 1-like, chloroplastic isoform X2 n=1 Tax=Salvia splendens TaxID=180675 RepID=UPI001C266A52|nr:maltose excess protein 1-like, chloroplastic isoform X2 [Salvia splendens]
MRLVVVVRDRPAAFGFTFVVSFSFLCWFLVNCFAFLFFWNLPFLLLQLPQIILNYRNLMAGNNSAFLAVPWLGMLTGLLGNLSLLSYFIKKKESEAVAIQLLGVVSIYVAILQLAMAEAMTLPHFVATSIVTASGVIINSLKHFDLLNNGIWKSWEEFITIAGLSALPQVIWSTFVPIVPNTVFPGCIALFTAVLVVSKARMGKLSKKGVNILGSVSGWTATLLFMWMPVAQMWTNLLNPKNMKGLSAVTMLLAMIGNGLLIPRALVTRDLMWFTGSTWACVFYGWGNLVCLYRNYFVERCTSARTPLILKGSHFWTLMFLQC